MSGPEGQCLCGAVTVRLRVRVSDVGVCHCATCRRWGSGPWMALQVPDAAIHGDTLDVFQSSVFAERGFCGRCGTHIFHRPQDGPELAVSCGLFRSDEFRITRELCIDSRPPFYSFNADSEKETSRQLAVEWLPKLLWRRARRLLGRT